MGPINDLGRLSITGFEDEAAELSNGGEPCNCEHGSQRVGEGTGAALGMSLVESATKLLNEMATFSSAGVSEALG